MASLYTSPLAGKFLMKKNSEAMADRSKNPAKKTSSPKASKKKPTQSVKSTGFQWGGAREGAGRPRSSVLGSHLKRDSVGRQRPMLITLRVRSGFENLKNPRFFDLFEKACTRARRHGLRVIHFSLLEKRILMLVEIKSQEQLERSFKSLNTTLAIYLKKSYFEKKGEKHVGPVFLGRFQMEILHHPVETKQALKKIFSEPSFTEKKDLTEEFYSSSSIFGQFSKLFKGEKIKRLKNITNEHKQQVKKITSLPQFWLCQRGWMENPH